MRPNTDQLEGMTVFAVVVEKGSFTLAARQLGHSASYVSKEISRLEGRLGVRLLNRSTRKISLTDSGRTYYGYCRQIVADAEEAERSVSAQQGVPHGTLKISAPISFGHIYLAALLPEFLKQYPDVRLDASFDDRLVDLIAEGYDAVVRVTDLKDTSLISRRIMTSRIVTLAAPGYLLQRGRPRHPRELAEHDCITYSYLQRPDYWDYETSTGESIGVTIRPKATCNSDTLQCAMAVAGVGIARLPTFSCRSEIEAGALVPLLETFDCRELGVYALYPHRRHLSTKVRVFVDFLVARLAGV